MDKVKLFFNDFRFKKEVNLFFRSKKDLVLIGKKEELNIQIIISNREDFFVRIKYMITSSFP